MDKKLSGLKVKQTDREIHHLTISTVIAVNPLIKTAGL